MTTTSGLAWKIPGRVGDSPILGAGLYVDGDVGAAGSTGRGEANLYNLCSFLIVEQMRTGKSPKDAGMEALRRIQKNTVEKRLLNARGHPELRHQLLHRQQEGRVRRRVDVSRELRGVHRERPADAPASRCSRVTAPTSLARQPRAGAPPVHEASPEASTALRAKRVRHFGNPGRAGVGDTEARSLQQRPQDSPDVLRHPLCPAAVGWMPSAWLRAGTPATPSRMNGTRAARSAVRARDRARETSESTRDRSSARPPFRRGPAGAGARAEAPGRTRPGCWPGWTRGPGRANHRWLRSPARGRRPSGEEASPSAEPRPRKSPRSLRR